LLKPRGSLGGLLTFRSLKPLAITSKRELKIQTKRDVTFVPKGIFGAPKKVGGSGKTIAQGIRSLTEFLQNEARSLKLRLPAKGI